MQLIRYKRNQGELDEELLKLTEKVLLANPDIYTLWNIRREILMLLRKNNESDEEMSKLFDADLHLTEYCLKINPKSYCAWHHREWVLTTRADPDYEKELAVCEKYLKLDERNFHTWDYRRFVVGECKPPLDSEFNFTTEKLHDNFSNYSAWHYRSKLLVELYPDIEGGRPIQDNHHKHELKMVQSAAFTDPDDTSAWFYQRWLLGAVKNDSQIVVCAVTPVKATVAFNKHVHRTFVESTTRIIFNDAVVNGNWISCNGRENDCLWLFQHNETVGDNLDVKIKYETDDQKETVIQCVKYKLCTYIGKGDISFKMMYSDAVIHELENQLESCYQLLALEPDSKWTLLTTTIFQHCIDAKKYHEEVIKNLNTLKTIDKLRSGYYDDLITKWTVEEKLPNDYSNDSLQLKIAGDNVTSLPHLQYYSYCEDVDLSNLNLTSKVLPSLVMLPHCKKLSLENNKITSLKSFPNLDLEELNLKGNVDIDSEELESFKNNCKCNIIF